LANWNNIVCRIAFRNFCLIIGFKKYIVSVNHPSEANRLGSRGEIDNLNAKNEGYIRTASEDLLSRYV
jgi:hypothetical protein